ncbi:putative RNA methyltransferase At5g10620 isoform X2 [Salvia splendens]|uniref:putative RNA methyltransferase At5g10620 isoform X2 n=1 Tax=Salvia splendens TaxID=180675 RepID=UPI001C276293|nr:putative RNA methyltransferase At5g10620 isoform X2 [Salvia splendens]
MESAIFATVKIPLPSSGNRCKCAAQSVRALPIRILTVGKKRSAGIQLVVDEYTEKLKHYCPVQDVRIKSNPKNARDSMVQIEHEDMAVMGLIKSNEWVDLCGEPLSGCTLIAFLLVIYQRSCPKCGIVLMREFVSYFFLIMWMQIVMLDERGRDVSSEQMASLIADAGNTGASSILFCVGGPYGHGRQLRERADVSIRLSSLVLNHEIALVVLAEQLYRAWTILKGQKYHH